MSSFPLKQVGEINSTGTLGENFLRYMVSIKLDEVEFDLRLTSQTHRG
jgi:hypothetical protein